MRTTIVAEESEFEALQPEWDATLESSSLDGPYLRHDWQFQWWRAYGCGTLAIVTCRDETTGELLGVLPTYRCRVGAVWPSTTLKLLADGKGGATGLGAFAVRGAEEAAFDALVGVVTEELGGWDTLDLQRVSADDGFARHAARMLEASGSVSSVREVDGLWARPRIDLPATWDEYLGTTLGHENRRSVRRCRRRGDERGACVEMVTDADELPSALDEAMAIHESRMREVVSSGYRNTPVRSAFLHATCKTLLAENRLRLAFLVRDGQRVACECQMRHGTVRYAMWAGFLGEWAHEAVTKTLFSHLIEQAIDEGCNTLDFGLGEQEYKRAWGASRVERFGSLHVYASTMRGRLARGRDVSAVQAQRAFDAAPKAVRDPLWRLAQGARGLVRAR